MGEKWWWMGKGKIWWDRKIWNWRKEVEVERMALNWLISLTSGLSYGLKDLLRWKNSRAHHDVI